jgi:hypothetical protein
MLQIIRRKRFSKLPLQANYYPIPTMAFIQDKTFRFTIVTAQPLGIASLKEGQIEVSCCDEWKETFNLTGRVSVTSLPVICCHEICLWVYGLLYVILAAVKHTLCVILSVRHPNM